MKLGFEESQSVYQSASQSARNWTEQWVRTWAYCPNCGNNKIGQFTANKPVADFFCKACHEEFELKSQKSRFGPKIVDGAYRTMRQRLSASNNPNLLLMNYDLKSLSVKNLFVVPKHFFVTDIIEERKPLAPTARRAGWIGCNILLSQIPSSGKIFIVRDGVIESQDQVRAQWQKTLFLRNTTLDARGWLVDVMKCVDEIKKQEFSLEQVYAYEARLSLLYPKNRHIRQKIRQQLQVLRDQGYLEFIGRGHYRVRL